MAGEIVLVLDDQRIVVDVAEEILKSRGYKVLTAYSAPEALGKLNERPDIVLCDILLGDGATGYDFMDSARGKGYDGPFVFMSAFDKRSEALARGGSGYVRKPFDSKLPQIIANALVGEAGAL
ncbi:MAG: response regulator [Candidatus Aenigmarchaeota archaeon]|nr:response regulator [Candidatus Aenigmarchaeota archaeon]